MGGPVSLSEISFVRRISADGTTHSICIRCFVTIVIATRESDLDRAEQNHACDPRIVAHWKELADRDPSDGWNQKPPRRH